MDTHCISVREAAKLLGISATKMYELARSDGFPSFTVGNRILVSAKGLADWVEKQVAANCHS